MNRLSGFIVTLLIGSSLIYGGIQDAEAKRFGGARSFGSKPSYSNPYRRSTTKPTRSASQQRASQQNQAARQSMSRRGGLMGMLGGLALGGLLGAMFFGGAFAGLNFMDILVFGGIAYLLYKLFYYFFFFFSSSASAALFSAKIILSCSSFNFEKYSCNSFFFSSGVSLISSLICLS